MRKFVEAVSKACSVSGNVHPSSCTTSTSRVLELEADPRADNRVHGETNSTSGRRASAARKMSSHSGESPAKATRTLRKG